MSDTSGPTWRMPFAFYDPDESCWRTSQATFLSDSDRYSATWPKRGTTRAGYAYELPTPALPTTEPASSLLLSTPDTAPEAPNAGSNRHSHPSGLGNQVQALLPTPAVNDMGAGKTVEAWDEWTDRMRAKHGNGNGHGPSLAIEAQRLFPTPRATDGTKGGPNQRGSSGDLMLPSADMTLLPTPMTAYTSRDAETLREQRRAGNGQRRILLPDLRVVVEEVMPGAPMPPPSLDGSESPAALPLDPPNPDAAESA